MDTADRAERLGGLFDAHADRLYRLARRLTPCADDAFDLVQDAFLRAVRSANALPDGFRDEEAWLIRVLVNIRRDQWRKEAVRRRYDTEQRPTPPRTPEPAYLIRADIWKALDALTPRRRAVLVMHELDGMSTSAIASLLGISAITVRWHLSRGRRQLAQRLGVHTGVTDEHTSKSITGWRPASPRTPAR